MRQFFMLALVAVAASLTPAVVWADNPNQEAAQRIKNHLNENGQLGRGEKIAVRYLNGTVWLQGHVRTPEHLNSIVALVFATEGVAVNQVIRDELTCDSAVDATGGSPANGYSASNAANPLRGSSDFNRAQALPASFNSGQAATPVANLQAVAVPAPANLPSAEVTSGVPGAPLPMYPAGAAVGGPAPVCYNRAAMPGYAWPSYAAYPNYAAVTYPKQYSPTAWPYIGPFYPYPQVPLGWRKVSLQWDDGWWWLEFKDKPSCCWWR